MATQMLQVDPRLDFMQARQMLADNNWDLGRAINAYMNS